MLAKNRLALGKYKIGVIQKYMVYALRGGGKVPNRDVLYISKQQLEEIKEVIINYLKG